MPMSREPASLSQGLRQAAPYIHAHRGRCFVVYLSGEVIRGGHRAELLHDIALLHSLGVQLVVVHGARPQIDARLADQSLTTRFGYGRRITPPTAINAVLEAVTRVRTEIEGQLSMGLVNTPMAGSALRVIAGNFVRARPFGIRQGIDFGHSGEVRRVDTAGIRAQLGLGNLVLISNIGYSATGELFNMVSDRLAVEVAMALQADKLVWLWHGGPLVDDQGRWLRQLEAGEAQRVGEQLAEDRPEDSAEGGPTGRSLRAVLGWAAEACENGVERVHLIPGNDGRALLDELFSRDGAGTLVTRLPFEDLRPARLADIGGILELIGPLVRRGLLVARTEEQLELEIDDYYVVERDGLIVASAALFPYPEEGVGELACLVVHPAYRQGGRGSVLLDRVERLARAAGLASLVALSTQTGHWFREHGFTETTPDALPAPRRQLYDELRGSRVYRKSLHPG